MLFYNVYKAFKIIINYLVKLFLADMVTNVINVVFFYILSKWVFQITWQDVLYLQLHETFNCQQRMLNTVIGR